MEKRPLVFGINRVGDPDRLFNPPGYEEDVYRRLHEIGSAMVRLAASPREIERERGKRDWSDFERDLELAEKYGLEPMVCIVNTPGWASPTGEPTYLYPYKMELMPEFINFCQDLGWRTRGRVKIYQLWNEQNGCSWHFHDGFNHADEYVPFLRECYRALKSVNPECIVSLGALDDAEGNARYFLELTYEERDKHYPGERIFDAISDHPYSHNIATMKAKIDVLAQILEQHGDGGMPIFITEYGWHTGRFSLEEQARLTAEALEAFSKPEWNHLIGAIQLSIGDFEGAVKGWGVCDSNLRPRPAFHAFQGAPRFGASPPHTIKWSFPEAGSVEISWKTVLPASCAIDFNGSITGTDLGTEHKVRFDGINQGGRCSFAVTSKTADGLEYTSAQYSFRMPALMIHNGGFEDGFFAGIADEWTIEGDGSCTDAALIPEGKVRGGNRAQAVYAKAGESLDSTLHTFVTIEPGSSITLRGWWAGSGRKIEVRCGIGYSEDGRIIWSDWMSSSSDWQLLEVSATVDSSIASLYFQCRVTEDTVEEFTAFYLDDVSVESGV